MCVGGGTIVSQLSLQKDACANFGDACRVSPETVTSLANRQIWADAGPNLIIVRPAQAKFGPTIDQLVALFGKLEPDVDQTRAEFGTNLCNLGQTWSRTDVGHQFWSQINRPHLAGIIRAEF